jgi:hypothetical protein
MTKATHFFLVLMLLACRPIVADPVVEWGRQFGTGSYDQAFGVSADRMGSVYVAGTTTNDVVAPVVNPGAYVAKYNAQGSLQWSRQIDIAAGDSGHGVSADVLGNVFVSGFMPGISGDSRDHYDVFVSKHDAGGTLQWTRSLATTSPDVSYGVSADGLGNVYISGYTDGGDLDSSGMGGANPFLSKYSTDGTLQWTRQDRSLEGIANDVSTDGIGNVYLSGTMVANRSGGGNTELDAYLSKYDATGALQWTKQLGTTRDERGWGVSADGLGNVFMWGYTTGDLAAPSTSGFDAFISKYNDQGQLQWTRQLGTFSLYDSFGGVSADGLGNVYFAGHAQRTLAGGNIGPSDAIVGKFSANGDLVWNRQYGTGEMDDAYKVSWDGNGSLYVAGRSFGSLWGMNAGLDDAFLMKINDPIPEPTPLQLAAIATLVSLCSSTRSDRSTRGTCSPS